MACRSAASTARSISSSSTPNVDWSSKNSTQAAATCPRGSRSCTTYGEAAAADQRATSSSEDAPSKLAARTLAKPSSEWMADVASSPTTTSVVLAGASIFEFYVRLRRVAAGGAERFAHGHGVAPLCGSGDPEHDVAPLAAGVDVAVRLLHLGEVVRA